MEKLLKTIEAMEGKTVEAAIQCQVCSSSDDEPSLIKFTDGTVIKLGVAYADEVGAEDSIDYCCQAACGLLSQKEYDEKVAAWQRERATNLEEEERRTYERLKAKFEK